MGPFLMIVGTLQSFRNVFQFKNGTRPHFRATQSWSFSAVPFEREEKICQNTSSSGIITAILMRYD